MKLEDYLPLAAKLAHRDYTEEELASVIAFLQHADRADAELFLDEYARMVGSLSVDYPAVPELPVSLAQVRERIQVRKPVPRTGDRSRTIRLQPWLRYAAAILVVGILSYVATETLWKETLQPPMVTTADTALPLEIPPAGNRATLTLSNGEVIVLDSASDGQLAVQHGTSVVKQADQIIYKGEEPQGRSAAWNTMSTPRGGQYTLLLADGTRIWLNAASSITYPTFFEGNERVVKVTGEVYFEVARRTDQPFVVEAAGDRITVLGTVFNVRAYAEEGVVKTSLVEGSVRINDTVLNPGQAYINGEVIETNIEQDVAWRNGYFNFHNMDLQAVMLELGRWYDVGVAYPDGVPQIKFGGELQRNLDLAQVLKALEKSKVRFRMETDPQSGTRTLVVLN